MHADERGSIIAVSNGSGAVTTINSYDEYGIPAAANAGRFQYTGQTWLPDLGMYHYKARIYSPTLGRFMQTDPIGYAAGMNLYGYVGGDPVNFVDPSGQCSVVQYNWYQNLGGGRVGEYLEPAGIEMVGCDPSNTLPGRFGRNGGNRGYNPLYAPAPLMLGKGENCSVGNSDVNRAGSFLRITGEISFPNGQSEYREIINSAWSGLFGVFSVVTQLKAGNGGLVAYISNPVSGRPSADVGGPKLFLNNLVGASPNQLSYSTWSAGHEFGHSLGLKNLYDKNTGTPYVGHENSIMSAAGNSVTESDIREVLKGCK